MGGLKWYKKVFALYVLQLERFRWSRTFVENGSPNGIKNHPNRSLGCPRSHFWDFAGFWQACFLIFVRLAKRRAKVTNKSTFGRLQGSKVEILDAMYNPAGLLYWQILADFTFLCLTTPDTSRCRRILAHTGFWRDLKINSFRITRHKIAKRVSRKASWKNMVWGLIFDAEMGCLEKPKQAFRIIHVVKHQFSGSHEIYRKLMPKQLSKS